MKSLLTIVLWLLTLPALADQQPQPPAKAPAPAVKSAEATNSSAGPAATSATAPAPAQQRPSTAAQPKIEPTHGRHGHPEAAMPDASSTVSAENVDETPVVTHHTITLGKKTIAYTTTVQQMPIKNGKGETEAHIFYTAYTLDGADHAKRPVTFAFNGGPGSASIWVHMGAMGPRSPKLLPNGDMPRPPFRLIDDESTWLDVSDLVFIDPVGTGYSRAKTPEIAHRMNSVNGDLESVGEFVRMYITRNERWGSPLFIAGESYGTFRAAGLAGRLLDDGIAVNGIVLISTVLDKGVIRGDSASGLALELPTFTADAWFHKKLPADLQEKSLKDVLKESEHWATSDYIPLLNRGTDMSPAERKAAIAKLARYTGLKPRYIEENDLRIRAFTYELLQDEKLVIGSYDGRLTAPKPINSIYRSEPFDPSGTLVRPPFTAAFQQYMRGELGYKTDMEYNVLVGLRWDWQSEMGYAETADDLKTAFYKNPHLKVMVCSGYFDSVTPYFSVRYTFDQLGLRPEMLKNIDWQYYEAGHMMYIDAPSHKKLKQDFANFVKKSLE